MPLISFSGVGNVISSASLTSTAAISSVSPPSGSQYGGVLVQINGNGFSGLANNTQVTIGSSACTIVQITSGQVQCIAPAQGSSPSVATITIVSNGVSFPTSNSFTYSAAATPTISSINPTSGSAGQTLTITGSNFVSGQTSISIGGTPCAITNITSTSIVCTVGSSPAGNQPVIASVVTSGRSASSTQFQYTLQVSSASPSQGSFGGGQSVVVSGDGFNASSITVTICNTPCQSVSVLSNTQLTCVTPAATYQSSGKSCNLVVTVGGLTQTVSYVYQSSLTATVSAVSPKRGGTGGGTTLTITGTNFP